jgi:hypothetical protein
LVSNFAIDFKALESFYLKLSEIYPDDQDMIPLIQNLIASFAKEAQKSPKDFSSSIMPFRGMMLLL